MPRYTALLAPMLVFSLGGCLAKTIVDVATLPVRGAAQAADWATTSQDEQDRARGREIRQREERLGELQGDYDTAEVACERGDDAACRRAVTIRREMDELLPSIPVEPAQPD
jgi:hypothetical protein